jgi:hypothetical protein
VEHLARVEITNLESEQTVHVDEAECLPAVDGERPDDVAERANLLRNRVAGGIGHVQQRRSESGEIDRRAVEPEDRVVRTRVGVDPFDHVARARIDDVPMRPFERRHVQNAAVRGDGHAVAPAVVLAIPGDALGLQVDGGHAPRRRHVQTTGFRVQGDTLDETRS